MRGWGRKLSRYLFAFFCASCADSRFFISPKLDRMVENGNWKYGKKTRTNDSKRHMHTRWGVCYKKKNLKIKLECCDSQAPLKKTMTKRSSQEQQEKKRCDSFLIFRSKNEWKSRSLLCVSLNGCEWVLIKSGLRGKLTDNIKPSIFRELLFRAARLQRDTAIRKEISMAQWPRIPQHTAVCMNHLHSKRKMVESKKVVLRKKRGKSHTSTNFASNALSRDDGLLNIYNGNAGSRPVFDSREKERRKKTRVENNSPVFQRARTANNADIYGLLQKNKKKMFFFSSSSGEKKNDFLHTKLR